MSTSFARLLTELALSGVELRADGDDLLFRPARLPDELLAQIRRHKPALLAAARERAGSAAAESAYVRDERLGIAEDLGMDISPGSPAMEIAERESRRIAPGIPPRLPRSRARDLIDHALAAFADIGGLRCVACEPITAGGTP